LQCGPDLIGVSARIRGRNGSGKSSFAEALEYALTRENPYTVVHADF
jgi:DNA repair exonuclease SbcCD ATPase subunit